MEDLEKIVDFCDNPTTEQIFTHLCYVSKLLSKNKIKHWICYGTLLGAVREKNIIGHDYDFDLGIMYSEYSKVMELNKEINEKGYSFEKGFGCVYQIPNIKESAYKWRVSLKIKFKDQIVGDMYIYYASDDGFLRRYDPEEKIYYYPNSTFPSLFVEDLIECEINGESFPAPRFPEILVEHFYGPHWKTPIKALSQNGQNHPDYDFYGNYIFSSLEYLTNFLNEQFSINLQPQFNQDLISYIFPLEQLDWIMDNEKVKIKVYKK